MKKTLTVCLCAILLLLTAACGDQSEESAASSGSASISMPDVSAPDEPDEPEEPENPEEPETPSPEEVQALYEPILDQIAQAFLLNYDSEQLYTMGINELYSLYDGASVGYAFLDIDGNGVEELLIGPCSYGSSCEIYDLYTIVDGETVIVCRSFERFVYQLCYNGYLDCFNYMMGYTRDNYYKMNENGELSFVESLCYDQDTSPENPWFYSNADIDNAYETQISEEEYQRVMNRYTLSDIYYTSFQSYAEDNPDKFNIPSFNNTESDTSDETSVGTSDEPLLYLDMDDLLSSSIYGETLLDASDWADEWMFSYIYGSSDPDEDTVFYQEVWTDANGNQTYGGITQQEAADAGWGDIWVSLVNGN